MKRRCNKYYVFSYTLVLIFGGGILKKETVNSAAIYCRLSRDDGFEGESNSIGQQRDMLSKYCKDNGFTVYKTYSDDGYSGTTFERPSFKEMIEDIENGKVDIVIVKDLSRLGRNNAVVAHYTELYFPQNNVRFIAVNDAIDTFRGENEIMGFKSILNEYYARDISKKVRSSKRTSAIKGDFIGSRAPYGYKKDPNNKNRLIPDEYTSDIVKRIFLLAVSGVTPMQIKTILSGDKIMFPTAYLHSQTGQYGSAYNVDYPYAWKKSTITQILTNRVYVGDTVSGKQRVKSFKFKKLENVPPDEWIIVPDTHEAIIDRETFDHVQEILSIKRQPNSCTIDNIFAGKLVCESCGCHLCFAVTPGRKSPGSFVCNSYKRRSGSCTAHYTSYKNLYEIVLYDIKNQLAVVKEHEENLRAYTNDIMQNIGGSNEGYTLAEIEKMNVKLFDINRIIKKLLEQNALGVISDERFAELSSDYEKESLSIKTAIARLNERLEFEKAQVSDVGIFYNTIHKYINIDKLTADVIIDMIDKIIIHEAEGERQYRKQKIEIIYRFGGLN
jgi:DNA invertase Pin-like site-specific DNA recombinase